MMKKVGAGGCRPLFFRNSSCYRFKSVFWPADRRIDSWKYRRQIRDIQEGEKMSLKTVRFLNMRKRNEATASVR